MKSSLKVALLAMFSFFVVNTLANAQDMPSKDLVQVATDEGNFTIWNRALEQAGLVQTLKGDGPYTVFAPTDDAFSKLPEGQLDSLMADNDALREFILNHVAEGDLASEEVSGMVSVPTMGGASVMVGSAGTSVKVNDAAIVQADLTASNGRIHAVDTVLFDVAKE